MTTKMKQLLKGLYAVCIMAFVIGFTSLTVRAETTDEIEPNDTMESAQTIQANSETAVGFVDGTFFGQHIINGYTSSSDEDWFMVYLKAGKNYLTCNCCTFDFEVRTEGGEIVSRGTYLNGTGGIEAFLLNIPCDGYYYVRIKGVTATLRSYLFLIGGPTYSISSNVIRCATGTIRMTSGGGKQTGLFYGELVSFPEDAIVNYVRINGLNSYAVKSIKLTNKSSGQSMNLNKYTWDKKGLVGLNMVAASRWSATFEYSRNTTFTPTLTVEYIYPIYSTPVD